MGFLSGLEKTAILNFFTARSCARGQAVFVLETLYIFEPEISNKQASKTKFSYLAAVDLVMILHWCSKLKSPATSLEYFLHELLWYKLANQGVLQFWTPDGESFILHAEI